MNNKNPKQVIVIRKDLNMRRGKQIAQGSHASLAVILDMMKREETSLKTHYSMSIDNQSPIQRWLEEKFTKICVSVDTEKELLELFEQAKQAKIPTVLITDAGLTEFNGVPTNTCIAVGPWDCDEIDKITGHLKLL